VTLVSLIEPSDAHPSVRAALNEGMQQYGTALSTWRALLHRPEIFNAYMPYLRAVAGPGEVPQRVKEAAALTVALLNHCRYSVSHRYHAAIAAGLTDDEVAALARGEASGLPASERLAVEYARQLTLRPPQVTHADDATAVDPSLLAELRTTFSEPQLVELTADIALWNALTRFHRVMDFPLDMPSPPETIDAVL
jgi:AhpD family alkylhydroperoxidase